MAKKNGKTKGAGSSASSIGYYRQRRQKLTQLLGGRCEKCGASDCELHFHHMDFEEPNGSHALGGWQMVYKVEAEISQGINIQLLCRDCHMKVHGLTKEGL